MEWYFSRFYFIFISQNPRAFITKVNPDLLEIGLLVGFVVSSTGTRTSKLSGITAMGVTYKQGPIMRISSISFLEASSIRALEMDCQIA